jgi:hypothetical protein
MPSDRSLVGQLTDGSSVQNKPLNNEIGYLLRVTLTEVNVSIDRKQPRNFGLVESQGQHVSIAAAFDDVADRAPSRPHQFFCSYSALMKIMISSE